MKKRIYLLIATATLIFGLCGLFFYQSHTGISARTSVPTLSPVSSVPYGTFSRDTASKALSLCSVSYYPETLEAKLKELGYGQFKYYSREQDTVTGSGIAFGVATAWESNGNASVIAVFRGTNDCEWYSNFSIGEETEHAGFSAAADFAMSKLSEYLAFAGIENSSCAILITGHSRGGAVANLCAKRLIDNNSFTHTLAYTFASPNTTTSPSAHNDEYRCIFNIQNPEDFICYIPLEEWGYTKYGTIINLPNRDADDFETLYENMEKKFLQFAGYEHTGYPNNHDDVKEFLEAAYTIAPTISDYYNRRITAYPYQVTLHEYMNKVASLLCGRDTISNGMFLMASGNSPLFRAMTEFMLQGIDIEKIAQSGEMTGSAVACGHTYETYEAWLGVLSDKYFEKFAVYADSTT